MLATERERLLHALIMDRGVDAAFEELAKTDGAPAAEVEAMGCKLLGAGHTADAVAVFRLHAAFRPASAVAHAHLGEAYEKNSQHRWALASFARAARIATANEDAKSDEYQAGAERAAAALRDRAPPRSTGRVRSVRSRVARTAHVLHILDVAPGQTVADVGCGSGWLSKAVAEAVGATGRVYALEIRASAVESMRRRALPNVVPVLSDPGDVKLPRASVDVVFLHDVATHVDRKVRPQFYASVARALRRDGRLVVFGHHGMAIQHLAEFERYGFVLEDGQDLAGLNGSQLNARYKAGIRFRHKPRRRVLVQRFSARSTRTGNMPSVTHVPGCTATA